MPHLLEATVGQGERDPKDWDVTNGLKLLEDAMCGALGIKDCRVINVYELRKADGPWGVTATIRPYRMD